MVLLFDAEDARLDITTPRIALWCLVVSGSPATHRVSRFRHGGVRAADWTTQSQVTVLKADDDCVGSPMWRVICQRGPKQSGVDVPGDVSDNGCAAGTSPRKRSPVPLRTVSGRAIARPWHCRLGAVAAALQQPMPTFAFMTAFDRGCVVGGRFQAVRGTGTPRGRTHRSQRPGGWRFQEGRSCRWRPARRRPARGRESRR